MGDYIRLQHGAPPWEASGDPAHHVETYHHHDIPLIGVIRQGGENYLFHCFVGEVERFNLWSYTAIQPEEIATLETVAPGEEFDEAVAEFSARPGVWAIALDGFGIIASRTVTDLSDAKSHLAALLDELHSFMEELINDAQAQERRLVAIG